MDRNQYLPLAARTWDPTLVKNQGFDELDYLLVGLLSEIGEVCDVLKRHLRDGPQPRENLVKELGDTLWYATMYSAQFPYRDNVNYNDAALAIERNFKKFPYSVASYFMLLSCLVREPGLAELYITAMIVGMGIEPEEVRRENIAKLADRVEKGKLYTKGGDR